MTSRILGQSRWLALSTGVAIAALSSFASSAKAADFSLNFDATVDGSNLQTYEDGSLVTTQWSEWGLQEIYSKSNRTGKTAKLNTYDSDVAGGQDDDLETGSQWGTASQGNVLIIQEEDKKNKRYLRKNNQYRADDDLKGGTIRFDFEEEVRLNRFSLLDIDDNGKSIRVKGYSADGQETFDINIDTLLEGLTQTYGEVESNAYKQSVSVEGVTVTQMSNKRGDNSLFEFTFEETYLSDIEFIYPGSGAIAGLDWSTPEVRGPRKVPEPSALVGLLMLGVAGKWLKRKQVS